MPTPRPFGAPTQFTPQINPLGEVTRQVERMRKLTPSQTPAAQNFLQQMVSKLRGIKPPSMPQATAVQSAAGNLSVLGGGLAAGFAVSDYMQKNSAQNVSTSGRGAGRAAFQGGNKKNNVLQPKPQTELKSFVEKGINPKTGLPWSESPGKSDVEPINSPDRPSQPPSNSTPAPEPPGPMTMADVDAMYGRLGLGSYSGRNATQADPSASVQLPESLTSFYLPEEKKADYKFTDDTGVNTSLQLETEKPLPGFNPEATKNLPDSFGLTGGMSGQSSLSKALSEVKPVESTKTPREKASDAFLDAEDSLLGLRARDRELGLVYAEGKYYTQNPNMGKDGENDFSLLKNEEAKQVISGEEGAQELLKKRLAALQDETPANAAELQAPLDVSQFAPEDKVNAYPIQQEEPKLTGNKLEDIFNSGYEGNVPRDIQMYKDFNALSEEDRERIFSRFRI